MTEFLIGNYGWNDKGQWRQIPFKLIRRKGSWRLKSEDKEIDLHYDASTHGTGFRKHHIIEMLKKRGFVLCDER